MPETFDQSAFKKKDPFALSSSVGALSELEVELFWKEIFRDATVPTECLDSCTQLFDLRSRGVNMTNIVLGNGPVEFTAPQTGSQLSIPLSQLYFDASGQINASQWPLYMANQTVVDSLLEELVDNGFLRPGSSPPPKPAIVLKAAVLGAAGNNIQVAFSELKVDTTTPANTTFKATITAKDTYPGLSYDSASAAFIKKILGTETVGEKPCLIRVKDTDTPSQPKEGSYSLIGGNATTKSSKGIDGVTTGTTAFTAEAWKNGDEGNSITVTISQVNAAEKTFTLGVELKQPTIPDIKLSDLPTKLAGSEIVLTVAKPDGGDFAIPALGTVGLSGGSDAKAAASASAIIVAKT